MDDDIRRRLPCSDRKIKDLGADDIRVRLTGTIVDSNEGRAIVDDGTGQITVNSGETNLESGKFLRIFGRVIPVEKGFEIQGEVFQDFSGVDIELLRKVEKAERG